MDTDLLVFATQIMVMSILVSTVLLLLSISIVVFIHVCVVNSREFRFGLGSDIGGQRGLSKDELEKLPCYEFNKVGDDNASECAVCLESLQVGERCRLLPACGHSFHAQCVDCWLLKSSLCPICRAKAGAAAVAAGWENMVVVAAVETAEIDML